MAPAGTDVPPQHYLFSEATVFTQWPDTPHLLVVSLDAERVNVNDHITWRPLSFEHNRIPNTDRTYSSVVALGSQQHLAAPGAPHWVPQLLPSIYDYQPRTDQAGRILPTSLRSAGLIGSLPLLLALAAFSGPESQLDTILTQSLRRGVWVGHMPPRGGKLPAFFYHN